MSRWEIWDQFRQNQNEDRNDLDYMPRPGRIYRNSVIVDGEVVPHSDVIEEEEY